MQPLVLFVSISASFSSSVPHMQVVLPMRSFLYPDSKPFSAILCHCCDWGIRPSHTLVCGGTPEAHAYQIRFCVLVCSFPNHSLIVHFLFFFLFFPFLQLHLNTGLIVSTLAPHSGIAINQSPQFYMQI